MTDENKTNDTTQSTGNDDTQSTEKDISDLEKLKASNDEFEKELIRGRELKAERQKLEAEKILGGSSGGHVEPVVKEETPKEYRDRIDKEIAEGKHDD